MVVVVADKLFVVLSSGGGRQCRGVGIYSRLNYLVLLKKTSGKFYLERKCHAKATLVAKHRAVL